MCVARFTEDIALDFSQEERRAGIEVLGEDRRFETPKILDKQREYGGIHV
jgi:hypothetical protein